MITGRRDAFRENQEFIEEEIMNISDIPFNRHIALRSSEKEKGMMSLPYSREVTNHLGTIHASAQFALAEACSGQFMLNRFPEYVDGYVAVLRKSDVKYRKQTKDTLYATAGSDEESINGFVSRLKKKDRALLPIRVIVKDEKEIITMQGTFEWYVQKTETSERSNEK